MQFFVGISKNIPFEYSIIEVIYEIQKMPYFQKCFVAFFQKINAHYFPNFCNNALLHYLIFKNNALLHISRKSNAIMKCITAIMHYWKSAWCCILTVICALWRLFQVIIIAMWLLYALHSTTYYVHTISKSCSYQAMAY